MNARVLFRMRGVRFSGLSRPIDIELIEARLAAAERPTATLEDFE